VSGEAEGHAQAAGPRDQRAAAHYRPDIDGLRAIAVLAVVAFHLHFKPLSGGYVGVDVFFVISGYLIGAAVLRQMRAGTYSLGGFYVRRLRRLAPALAAMLLAATVAVCAVGLPRATYEFGQSLMATTLFASNFWFLSNTDYFHTAAKYTPLIHTWSLAVEEQFYLLFPLLMLALRRLKPPALLAVLCGLAAASLGLSQVMLAHYHNSSFYLLPTRLWELLLGVIVLEAKVGLFSHRAWREAAAWLGLGAIAVAVLVYLPAWPFPGLLALAPCVGAALVLAAGAGGPTLAGRLLALPPLVFFGLISYSLYLWHWPIIVLLKLGLPADAFGIRMSIGVFVLSTVVAWVSWRLIERPFRNPALSDRMIVTATVLGAVGLFGLGAALALSNGWPQRLSPQARRYAAMSGAYHTNDFRTDVCFIARGYSWAPFRRDLCLARSATRANVLLIGDSHAAHLWSGLAARRPELQVQQVTAAGCKPVLRRRERDGPVCAQMKAFLFDDYLPRRPGERVILAASWSAADEADVGPTLEWLRARGFRVVLVGAVVRYNAPLPSLMAMALQRHDPGLVDRFRATDGAGMDAAFRAIAKAHGADYWSPYATLCPAGRCRITDDRGDPVQYDYGHLTAAGSAIVAQGFPAGAMR
jgi:peptidoglycan/LPS O-acetylase OafA/YrhL